MSEAERRNIARAVCELFTMGIFSWRCNGDGENAEKYRWCWRVGTLQAPYLCTRNDEGETVSLWSQSEGVKKKLRSILNAEYHLVYELLIPLASAEIYPVTSANPWELKIHPSLFGKGRYRYEDCSEVSKRIPMFF